MHLNSDTLASMASMDARCHHRPPTLLTRTLFGPCLTATCRPRRRAPTRGRGPSLRLRGPDRIELSLSQASSFLAAADACSGGRVLALPFAGSTDRETRHVGGPPVVRNRLRCPGRRSIMSHRQIRPRYSRQRIARQFSEISSGEPLGTPSSTPPDYNTMARGALPGGTTPHVGPR